MLEKLAVHEELAKRVVRRALGGMTGSSALVVVPPCFGSSELGAAIHREASRSEMRPRVARVSPDEVPSIDGYRDALAREWEVRENGSPRQESLETSLRHLVSKAGGDRPLVQIVDRFHRFLDCLEAWVLGLLRSEEQAGRLRTIVLSPFPYDEIKRRWEKRGLKLTVSNYGDKHAVFRSNLVDEDELRRRCTVLGIPEHITSYSYAISGGCPAVLAEVLRSWQQRGEPMPLDSQLQHELDAQACASFKRLLRLLDASGQTIYAESMVNVHLGVNQDESEYVLRQHPWGNLLLEESGRLRSAVLGKASVRWLAECLRSSVAGVMERATSFYDRRRYRAAVELVDAVAATRLPIQLQLLRAIAMVMATLFEGSSGEEGGGEDTNWQDVHQAVEAVEQVLLKLPNDSSVREMCSVRCAELKKVAGKLKRATRERGARVVDALGSAVGEDQEENRRLALLLVLLSIESGRATPGDAAAVRKVLAVPEQIYRLWSSWSVGIEFEEAGDIDACVRREVIRMWPHRDLTFPEVGEKYGSFEAFAYVAMALHLKKGSGPAPECSWQALKSALGRLQIRRDAAHATIMCDRRARTDYFALVDRWFDALLACWSDRVSRSELLAVIDPLPRCAE